MKFTGAPVIGRTPGHASFVDVFDRVLDKGVVIDYWARVSLMNIDLRNKETQVVVASIDTYLQSAAAIGVTTPIAHRLSQPGIAGGSLVTGVSPYW